MEIKGMNLAETCDSSIIRRGHSGVYQLHQSVHADQWRNTQKPQQREWKQCDKSTIP